jgi:molybdopterin/thiamine biosynthesis adenylyltransferase/rhodanese-related sulfurtransferase
MMTSFAKLFSIFLALNSISTYRVARGFAPMRIESLSYHQRTPSSTRTASITEDLSHEEISRYSRHLVLSDVGVRGQKALKNASVLVIGAGGLGAPCLMYLAAAGIGHIGIVDGDVVDESNLQRQIIHGTSTVGLSKCESAARRIQDINPHVNVRQYEEEFTSETALRILGDGFSDKRRYDVVIDGSDNFPTKYLINDACTITNTPWVYSAILAFEGQMSVFNLDNGPDYRDLLPTPPPPGDVPSCAEGGVLGVLPGTMGCLQATEVIKIVLGRTEGCMSGRVLIFDAMRMKFSEVGLKRETDRENITALIDYKGFCGGPQAKSEQAKGLMNANGRTMDEAESGIEASSTGDSPSFHNIDPQKALAKLSSGWSPWVVDVRLQTEHDIVALPFTDRVVPHRTIRVKDIPEDGDVLVYCKAGIRGKKACSSLVEQGVDPGRLFNLDGGIMKWQKELDPSMPRY